MKQGNIAHTKLYNLVMLHLDSPDNQKINIDPYHYNEENFDPILFHELLINVRLILENEKPSVNNMNSMGVDVACRIIIEICALLEANKQGKITDIQKKLFLLNYLTVDMDKQINKSMPDELRELLQNPYDKVIKDYQTLLGCSRAQAEQVNSERYSFLKYGGKTYSGWSSFIKTILGEEFVEYREMLNMFIHPAYTDTKITYFDEKLEDDRKKIINRILTLASSNIPELVNNDYVKSKWNDEYIDADNLERIKLIKKAFKETFKHNHNDEKWQNTSLEDDNTRYMAFSCFKKLGSTLIDMLICESLGLRNQTIIRVKSFAEMTSMLGVLIRCEDIDGIFDDFIRVSALFITNKHKNYYEVFNKVDSGNQLTENEEKKKNQQGDKPIG